MSSPSFAVCPNLVVHQFTPLWCNSKALRTTVESDAYEGLLKRNAQDIKSGAGQ